MNIRGKSLKKLNDELNMLKMKNDLGFIEHKSTREIPILFSSPMILKIIAGEKDITRRIVNPQPPKYVDYFEFKETDFSGQYGWGRKASPHFQGYMSMGEPSFFKIPARYAPGDRLWVRESFNRWLRPKNSPMPPFEGEDGFWTIGDYDYCYRADKDNNPDDKWRPSIFLPRTAARIFLIIVSVRIERLHEMDDMEALREGFGGREDFISYWNKLNEKRGFPWADNPWVYRLEYKKDK